MLRSTIRVGVRAGSMVISAFLVAVHVYLLAGLAHATVRTEPDPVPLGLVAFPLLTGIGLLIVTALVIRAPQRGGWPIVGAYSAVSSVICFAFWLWVGTYLFI